MQQLFEGMGGAQQAELLRVLQAAHTATRPEHSPAAASASELLGGKRWPSEVTGASLGPTGHSGPPGRLCHHPAHSRRQTGLSLARRRTREHGGAWPLPGEGASRGAREPPCPHYPYPVCAVLVRPHSSRVPMRPPGTWTARRQPQPRRGRRTARPTRSCSATHCTRAARSAKIDVGFQAPGTMVFSHWRETFKGFLLK